MKGRNLVLLLVGYALTVVQATLQSIVPFRVLVPELGLLVVLYAGLGSSGSLSGACTVAFLLGYVTDLLAGAPKGLFAMVFVLLCIGAKAASLRLLLRGTVLQAGFAFLASLAGGLLTVLLRSKIEGGTLAPLAIAPLQAAMTALLAPVLFSLFLRLEGRTSNAGAFGMGR